MNIKDINGIVKKIMLEVEEIPGHQAKMGEWTNASIEVKTFFSDHNDDIKKYMTIYDKEKGVKQWLITTSKGVAKFEQPFDFSFFDK